jgi:hypothetical protein
LIVKVARDSQLTINLLFYLQEEVSNHWNRAEVKLRDDV